MKLDKESILSADDIKTVKVKVPEWGGDIFVRTMTGTQRDAFEQSIIEGRKVNLTNVRAKLCVHAIVDEKGKRVFADSDIEKLGAKSSKALDRIYTVATELNGIRKEDIEDLAKNSGTVQSEDSISD